VADTQTGGLRYLLPRLFANLWRFRTLAFSTKAFEHVSSPCILKRGFLGYRLHLDVSRSNAQRLLYLEGERFVSELKLIRSLVKPADTVVDVGANIGYYALLFAKSIGKNGRIIAFEPEPDNLVELRLNVDRNGLRNTEIHPFAVGARAGTVAFARGINGGVRASDGPETDAAIQVPMVALDDVLAGPVNVIKIDVEGYEGEVLRGARKAIERWRPNLFVEIHPRMMAENHTVDGLFEFLSRYYTNVKLYQPARSQSMPGKIMARYFGVGSVESLPSREIVASHCRQGLQNTFWAVCRSSDRHAGSS
jgi:FkbM family methyltransferase